MDRKVVKLETAYGSERNWLVCKRNQDLRVVDLMEDVQKQFKIPMEAQVIFHKGKNLCDAPHETLEALGVENNHLIRLVHDNNLMNKSPRSKQAYVQSTYAGNIGNSYDTYRDNSPQRNEQFQLNNGQPYTQYQPYQYK